MAEHLRSFWVAFRGQKPDKRLAVHAIKKKTGKEFLCWGVSNFTFRRVSIHEELLSKHLRPSVRLSVYTHETTGE